MRFAIRVGRDVGYQCISVAALHGNQRVSRWTSAWGLPRACLEPAWSLPGARPSPPVACQKALGVLGWGSIAGIKAANPLSVQPGPIGLHYYRLTTAHLPWLPMPLHVTVTGYGLLVL